jgi:hypothetical protein
MARIRSVFPGLFTDEAFAPLSDAAQILLIGIWTESDDQGVFEWKPGRLRIRLRPSKDGSLDPMMAELSDANVIRQFEAGGKMYGACRNFKKYQRPKSPNKIFPLPPELVDYVTGEVTADAGSGHGSAVTDGGMNFPRDATATTRKRRQRARDRQPDQERDQDGSGHGSAVTDTANVEGVTAQPSPIPENGEVSRQREEIKGKKEESKNPPNPPSGGDPPSQNRKPKSNLKTGVPTDLRLQGLRDYFIDRAQQISAPNGSDEFDRFLDHHRAKGTMFVDWEAAGRTWLRNTIKFSKPSGGGSSPHSNRQTNGFVTRKINRSQEQHHEPNREPIDVTPIKPAGSDGTERRQELVGRE